jgi:hypothetical protein
MTTGQRNAKHPGGHERRGQQRLDPNLRSQRGQR